MKLLRDTNVGVDQALTDPNKGDYSKAHTTAIYVSLFMYIPISEPEWANIVNFGPKHPK